MPAVLAFSTPTEITLIAAAFFLLLAVISLLRGFLRKDSPWKTVKMGVFVERVQQVDEERIRRRWSEDDTKEF